MGKRTNWTTDKITGIDQLNNSGQDLNSNPDEEKGLKPKKNRDLGWSGFQDQSKVLQQNDYNLPQDKHKFRKRKTGINEIINILVDSFPSIARLALLGVLIFLVIAVVLFFIQNGKSIEQFIVSLVQGLLFIIVFAFVLWLLFVACVGKYITEKGRKMSFCVILVISFLSAFIPGLAEPLGILMLTCCVIVCLIKSMWK